MNNACYQPAVSSLLFRIHIPITITPMLHLVDKAF
jgi:hypothetical protein